MKDRPQLGTGWAFPVRPVQGRLTYVSGDTDIEQAIAIILRTSPPERVMLPKFGAGLREFLFNPNTPATHRSVEREITSALVRFEPRIDINKVTASASRGEPNVMLVEIGYTVRRTNTFYNRVFPFYLVEGS